MNLKNKKLLPYYIIGAVIVLAGILAAVLINTNFTHEPPAETTTRPEITTQFMNGEVPFYSDVPASSYPKESFNKNEDGRVVYADKTVQYATGIDVSSHQGEIDWKKVKNDGIDFAVVRIGFRGYGAAGNICEDDMAEKNIRGAAAAGLKVGVYFYSQATTVSEAEDEADFVLNIIKHYSIDYPVVFDWENDPAVGGMRTDNVTGNELTEFAVAFCEKIKAEGYTPGVYFNLNDAYMRYDLSKIKNYPFWYAQYEGDSPTFYYQYDIWQYSATGTVDGIKGKVDLNIAFSDYRA